MSTKNHGYVVVNAEGKPILDAYGAVILYKDPEAAHPDLPYGGRLLRTVLAANNRKRKKTLTQEKK